MNPLQLSAKNIMITGASSGIGRATAVLLSELGAAVVLVGRNAGNLQQTLDLMQSEANQHHRIAPFDLADVEKIPGWFADLVDETGPFDGFVHCAGIASLVPLRVLTLKHAEEVMRVNFYSAVALTKAFSRKNSHSPDSNIVLVASVAGLLGAAARTAYSGSKGALIAFARSAAIELAKSGIRVNCVAPAYVRTEMYDATTGTLTPDQLEALVAATQPLGLGTPRDVAYAIGFLLAETGRWITGSVLAVDGGYSAQ